MANPYQSACERIAPTASTHAYYTSPGRYKPGDPEWHWETVTRPTYPT